MIPPFWLPSNYKLCVTIQSFYPLESFVTDLQREKATEQGRIIWDGASPCICYETHRCFECVIQLNFHSFMQLPTTLIRRPWQGSGIPIQVVGLPLPLLPSALFVNVTSQTLFCMIFFSLIIFVIYFQVWVKNTTAIYNLYTQLPPIITSATAINKQNIYSQIIREVHTASKPGMANPNAYTILDPHKKSYLQHITIKTKILFKFFFCKIVMVPRVATLYKLSHLRSADCGLAFTLNCPTFHSSRIIPTALLPLIVNLHLSFENHTVYLMLQLSSGLFVQFSQFVSNQFSINVFFVSILMSVRKFLNYLASVENYRI